MNISVLYFGSFGVEDRENLEFFRLLELGFCRFIRMGSVCFCLAKLCLIGEKVGELHTCLGVVKIFDRLSWAFCCLIHSTMGKCLTSYLFECSETIFPWLIWAFVVLVH